ncbi:stress protein [Metabacillus arenae]|uniref:Stress protein n=1 Tax=Metabacillus arenae TaxID=2771434 RepID=A0A926NM38_9BACI|nr:stress protein [Metabacillus arenae]MBD1380331.1 stress protein [Metabacillus arenae]
MSRFLKNALEEQRNYYYQKLKLIGVYNHEVLSNMTISELKQEYYYFYHSIPSKKKRSKLS